MSSPPNARQIQPGSLRYAVAQTVLRLLYGRKWHYISPWEHASVVGMIMPFYEGKILLSQRMGYIELAGKYGVPGGHVDIGKKEGIEACTVRETYEETRIKIDIAKLTPQNMIRYGLKHNVDYFELASASQVYFQFIYLLSDDEVAQLKETEESANHSLCTLQEVEEMYNQNMLTGDWLYESIRHAFAHYETLTKA